MKSKFIYILLAAVTAFILNSCHCGCCTVPESVLAQTEITEDGDAAAFHFSESAADGCSIAGDCAPAVNPFCSKSFLVHGFRVPVRRNSNFSSASVPAGSCSCSTAVYPVSGFSSRSASDNWKGNSRYLISLRKLVI